MAKTATVSQINAYIKALTDYDDILRNVWVRGEISNFKHHSSGHMYMSLKDSGGVLRAVMFRSANSALSFVPENGTEVLARGRISVYERDGQYQLYIEEMRPVGEGDLYKAFEKLREKLKAEGLFDESRKKPIPRFPRAVGVITSPTGAAVRDIINILSRRFVSDIKIYPVHVQGSEAAREVAEAIRFFCKNKLADVLIVGRGGGSMEDLQAFNEEITARAVAESDIPVISAVGHETDFTICDFAADLRAPTPSAAAELAVPDAGEISAALSAYEKRISENINAKVSLFSERLSHAEMLISPVRLMQLAENAEQALDREETGLQKLIFEKITNAENEIKALCGKLDALSPLKVLKRGYAFVSDENGTAIKNADNVKINDVINVRLCGGRLLCDVREVSNE
mgnify:FL=1